MEEIKRLYRSDTDKMTTFSGVSAYVILWIVIPRKKTPAP
ncbi:MAG: PspC domain-containing protein [Tannerella sp.]|jgi:phage shock protein PspC (stress-responsive transcriptional regulator)|nr:PspC domain-containing protein [Tannerella sp.]